MRRKFDLEEIREFIRNTTDETSIYIGADSERYRRKKDGLWMADYTIAVVVHYDSCRGCKVFGEVATERDYDQKMDKPSMRLMNEVMKAAQLYLDLAESIGDRHFEVHLDINPDLKHGSSCVAQQAVGYIRGMCNVMPMIKPNAFAASYAADRLKDILAA